MPPHVPSSYMTELADLPCLHLYIEIRRAHFHLPVRVCSLPMCKLTNFYYMKFLSSQTHMYFFPSMLPTQGAQ